jgi:hypothetical protein
MFRRVVSQQLPGVTSHMPLRVCVSDGLWHCVEQGPLSEVLGAHTRLRNLGLLPSSGGWLS